MTHNKSTKQTYYTTMKRIGIAFIAIVISTLSIAQSEEFSLFVGGSYYIGDLNPNKHFDQNTNPALGFMYKKNSRNFRYAYRLQFMYGKIEAYDIQNKDPWMQNRDLNFSTPILELAAILEVNFMKYRPGQLKKLNETPYLFFGIAGFNFRPKGLYNSKWYDLQALGTEGQNTSVNTAGYYKLNQLAIPVGFGYKKNLNKLWTFSIEYGARILFTDYLDDVSKKYVDPTVLANEAGVLSPILADRSYKQVGDRNIGHNRGNSVLRDWYFFGGISFAYTFKERKECDTFDGKR